MNYTHSFDSIDYTMPMHIPCFSISLPYVVRQYGGTRPALPPAGPAHP
jgi:hypothetical protein